MPIEHLYATMVQEECLVSQTTTLGAERPSQPSVFAASFSACAVCLSLRARFRVFQDWLSVFGFGFGVLCAGVGLVARFPRDC